MDKIESGITPDKRDIDRLRICQNVLKTNIVVYSLYALYFRFRYFFSHFQG